ncbi:MAG: Bug family tripartite tricarboxylate transporter substrate binding protein [Beijerinckiaceae bacterium]
MKRTRIGAIALAAMGAFAMQGASAQDFYAGKTLTIVVGLGAGGSADTLVRTFAPYLRQHLPGQPNVVVQNMPGAGGVLAFNYIYERAAPDGQTIVFSLWDPFAQALGNQGLRARYDQYEFLGGISDIRVNYVRADVVPGGLKKPADIAKAKDLIVGAYGTTDVAGILAHLSLKTLGVPHRIVTGYRGGSDVFLAMQRGEVNVHNTSLPTYRTRSKGFIESGSGVGLAYLTPSDARGEFKKNANITDMPAFQDLYREIHGKLPSGKDWDALNWTVQQFGEIAYVGLAPPKSPEPALAALRSGIEKAMNDPKYVEESTKRNGLPFDYVNVETGRNVFKSLSNVSPEVLDTLRGAIGAMGAK